MAVLKPRSVKEDIMIFDGAKKVAPMSELSMLPQPSVSRQGTVAICSSPLKFTVFSHETDNQTNLPYIPCENLISCIPDPLRAKSSTMSPVAHTNMTLLTL